MLIGLRTANNVCIGRLQSRRFGGTKKRYNCSERDESNEEQLQCKQQYIYTLPGTLFLAMAMRPCGHIRLCEMSKSNAIYEMSKSH